MFHFIDHYAQDVFLSLFIYWCFCKNSSKHLLLWKQSQWKPAGLRLMLAFALHASPEMLDLIFLQYKKKQEKILKPDVP